jgi:broad specificity phosphatase PhoE
LTPWAKPRRYEGGQALDGITFDAVWASPLKRARKTAELIVEELRKTTPQLAPYFSDNLKEISLPLWEGMPFAEAEANFPELFQWRTDPAFCDGGAPADGNHRFLPCTGALSAGRTVLAGACSARLKVKRFWW